jgi:hypothetical protein
MVINHMARMDGGRRCRRDRAWVPVPQLQWRGVASRELYSNWETRLDRQRGNDTHVGLGLTVRYSAVGLWLTVRYIGCRIRHTLIRARDERRNR